MNVRSNSSARGNVRDTSWSFDEANGENLSGYVARSGRDNWGFRGSSTEVGFIAKIIGPPFVLSSRRIVIIYLRSRPAVRGTGSGSEKICIIRGGGGGTYVRSAEGPAREARKRNNPGDTFRACDANSFTRPQISFLPTRCGNWLNDGHERAHARRGKRRYRARRLVRPLTETVRRRQFLPSRSADVRRRSAIPRASKASGRYQPPPPFEISNFRTRVPAELMCARGPAGGWDRRRRRRRSRRRPTDNHARAGNRASGKDRKEFASRIPLEPTDLRDKVHHTRAREPDVRHCARSWDVSRVAALLHAPVSAFSVYRRAPTLAPRVWRARDRDRDFASCDRSSRSRAWRYPSAYTLERYARSFKGRFRPASGPSHYLGAPRALINLHTQGVPSRSARCTECIIASYSRGVNR